MSEIIIGHGGLRLCAFLMPTFSKLDGKKIVSSVVST
jgi:hypothetical protein